MCTSGSVGLDEPVPALRASVSHRAPNRHFARHPPYPPCYELLPGSDNTPCRVLGGYIWGNLLVHARVSEPSLNLQNLYVEHFGEVDDENQVIFT